MAENETDNGEPNEPHFEHITFSEFTERGFQLDGASGPRSIPPQTLIQKIEQLKAQQAAQVNSSSARRKSPKIEEIPDGNSSEFPLSDGLKSQTFEIGKQPTEDGAKGSDWLLYFLDSLMCIIPLCTVHICLDIMIYQQYRQELVVSEIATRLLKAIPVLFLLYFIVHPRKDLLVVQTSLVAASLAVGVYLFYCVNEKGYFASMRRAPPLGTLWVYTFLELDWYYALGSLLCTWAWAYYQGYSLRG